MLADKAYSHPSTRSELRSRRIKHTIPERSDQIERRKAKGSAGGRPPAFDPAIYKERNTIERGFNRLKHWRGIATRYDTPPHSSAEYYSPRWSHSTESTINRHGLVELGDAFQQAEADDKVRVVVLRGNGSMFSAGHDLGSSVRVEEETPGPNQHSVLPHAWRR